MRRRATRSCVCPRTAIPGWHADQIAAKIRKAKTDPEPLPDTAEGLKDRPEARNLVNIYAALSGHTVDQVVRDAAEHDPPPERPLAHPRCADTGGSSA